MASPLNSALAVNFAGRLVMGMVSLVVTPLYLHLLGAEGFGLIGCYLLAQAILGFASAGLADAANREAARAQRSGLGSGALHGYAVIAGGVGLAVGALLAAASGLIATHWLSLSVLSPATVRESLCWIAVLIGLQVPFDFFVGVCLGSQRYVAANAMLAGTALVRAVAGVIVLQHYAANLPMFFISQAIVLLGAMLWAAVDFVRILPASSSVTMLEELRVAWRVPAGLTAVAFTGMLLGQLDRLVVSRTLSLEDFGYYSVATTLANTLYFLIGPIQAAYFPEFSRHTGVDDQARLEQLYHEGCQRMAVVVIPVGMILVFFSRDVIVLWTSRAAVADMIAPVVAFLVGARLVGALNTLPYSLQFAHGWTSLVLGANLVALGTLAPGVIFLAGSFGATGAAAGYFLLSLPFLAFILWRTHRRLLPGAARRWLLRDTGPSLVAALLVAGTARLMQPAELQPGIRLAWLLAASAATLLVTVSLHAPSRDAVARWLRLPRADRLS